MPVPDYVRRDGVYNLGSHFPANTIGPDLGEFFSTYEIYGRTENLQGPRCITR